MRTLIERNTVIPTKRSRTFTTTRDNQAGVKIRVYEGERKMVQYNHMLGTFRLPVPKGRRGETSVAVTFSVDSNGILEVTAVNENTGDKQKMVVTNEDNRLNSTQMENMIKDAREHEKEDKEFMERYEALHKLEVSVIHTNNMIKDLQKELGAKLDADHLKSGKATLRKYAKYWRANKDNTTLDIEAVNEMTDLLRDEMQEWYHKALPEDQRPPSDADEESDNDERIYSDDEDNLANSDVEGMGQQGDSLDDVQGEVKTISNEDVVKTQKPTTTEAMSSDDEDSDDEDEKEEHKKEEL
eukprot:TRINITY_DN226_c1_g1_i1.p1 TRINITY_DN226_c1_g1~~TRINITY_DN226_c1_g1_i1.p1  ORF type:complete len:298 (+),score=150.54 TRINITY_DN226_c1_g1_i1:197-1090(+)